MHKVLYSKLHLIQDLKLDLIFIASFNCLQLQQILNQETWNWVRHHLIVWD